MDNSFIALGLMSGTSLDGIDASIIKSDGENKIHAKKTQSEYKKAMHFFSSRKSSWVPRIFRCSSLEKQGIENIWESAKDFQKMLNKSGELEKQRKVQASKWMWSQVKEGLLNDFNKNPNIKVKSLEFEKAVNAGEMLPTVAAKKLLHEWKIKK